MTEMIYIDPKHHGADHDNPVATLGDRVFFLNEPLKNGKDLEKFKDDIHHLLVTRQLKEVDVGEIGLTEKRIRFTVAYNEGGCFEKIGVKQIYLHPNCFIIYEGVIEPLFTFNTPKINNKLKPYVLELTDGGPDKPTFPCGRELIDNRIRGKEKDIVLVVLPELKAFVLKEKPLA